MKVSSLRKLGVALQLSHTGIAKAEKAGRIARGSDGQFDVQKCRRALERNTNPLRRKRGAALATASPSDGSGLDLAATPETGESLADSVARKESALASLRQLELSTKRGELVDVASMEEVWFTVGRVVRDNFLGLPDRLAPTLAAMSNAREIRNYLMEHFRQLLTALPAEIHKRAA